MSEQDHLFPKMKDSAKMTNFRGITVFIDYATFTKNNAFKTIYGVLAWPFHSNKWVVPGMVGKEGVAVRMCAV